MHSRPASPAPSGTPDRARLFYAAASAILLVFMFLGFQQFYLHGKAFPNRPIAPPIRTLVLAHGVSMTLWMVLMLVQPLLVVNRKVRLHMALGKAGAVLAACVFAAGVKLGIEATRISPPGMELWNLPYKQFMAVPVVSVTIFAAFVTAGILARKRPDIHRPMMLLATLAAMPAALDRIEPVAALIRHTVWGALFGPFFSTLVLGGTLLALKCALSRSFDRYFAAGWAALVLASAGIMKLAPTAAWDRFANLLLGY